MAVLVFDDLSWARACFVATMVAPTDAALSAQVVGDERIRRRLRRALKVESGLNDGIATPIVAFMLAVAASDLGIAGHKGSAEVGALVAGGRHGGRRRRGHRQRRSHHVRHEAGLDRSEWSTPRRSRQLHERCRVGGQRICRGAFVAGIAFGSWLDRGGVAVDEAVELPELVGEVLTLVVSFLFGAALVPIALHNFDVPVLIYALLTLTVLRIGPVALPVMRSGLDRPQRSVHGAVRPGVPPRSLFALLAIEELGESPGVERAVAVVAVTMLLSVVLHGVSAGPLGSRYVRVEQADPDPGGGLPPRRTTQVATAEVPSGLHYEASRLARS